MGLDRRVFRRGGVRVVAGLAAAGLVVALMPATVTSADVGAAPAPAAGRPPLAGKIVGIDPGHNGLNYTSPAFLNRKVWNGREWEGCDTTGTRTAGGYTVLEPVADGPNNKVIQPSMRFGRDVHAMMLRDTAMRISDYYGRDGYIS